VFKVDKILSIAPDTYKYFFSNSKINEKRAARIEERRGQLKVEADDHPHVKIVKEELLAYKSNAFTLDDRLLQLERLLDCLDSIKQTDDVSELIRLCQCIAEENRASQSILRNSFLLQLDKILIKVGKLQESSKTIARL
jgi:hypothetical protein